MMRTGLAAGYGPEEMGSLAMFRYRDSGLTKARPPRMNGLAGE